MIEIMKVEDILKIVELEQKVFKESLGKEFLYNELNLNPFQKYFIYKLNNEIIGYIGLRVYDDSAEVLNFLIDNKYHNKGYGTELFNYILKYLKNNNIKQLTLEVNVNNLKALKFYNKHNFEILYTRKNYYKNKEDAYVLKKDV